VAGHIRDTMLEQENEKDAQNKTIRYRPKQDGSLVTATCGVPSHYRLTCHVLAVFSGKCS
jgi:hypothetical protein